MVSGLARTTETPPDIELAGHGFPVGNLEFTVPAKWKIEPVQSPARGGQWRVPPPKPDGEGGQVVAFYFGPGIGGSPTENVEAWIGTMFNAEGHPAAAEVKHRVAGGLKITQVVILGTYNQIVTLPGIPPAPKAGYGLVGTVIENPQGNIYWRLTGPEALVTASLGLFNKMIDSVKPQDRP
jgi:hypothetical protein